MNADFDPMRAARLKQLMGAAFPALLDSFRATTQTSFHTLYDAIRDGRDEEARAIAHRMRSAFAQFGLIAAAARAEAFERRSPSGETDGGLDLAERIQRSYAAAQSHLAQLASDAA